MVAVKMRQLTGYKGYPWLVIAMVLGMIILSFSSQSSTHSHCTKLEKVETIESLAAIPEEDAQRVSNMEPKMIQPSSLITATSLFQSLHFGNQTFDCDSIEQSLGQTLTFFALLKDHPHKINTLRRHLMMNDFPCFEKLLPYFMEAFQSRLPLNHVSLHIPKTGGTSVCTAAENTPELETKGDNCWTKTFCPIWVGCYQPKPTTCENLYQNKKLNFRMNENWLDELCPQRTYSMILREPISRAMSHVRHLKVFLQKRKDKTREERPFVVQRSFRTWTLKTVEERRSLVQSNYMTWALTAYTLVKQATIGSQNVDKLNATMLYHNGQHPVDFRPQKEHLPLAKERLSQMDFLIDLSHSNQECLRKTLQFMKIHAPVGHKNANQGAQLQHGRDDQEFFNVTDFAEWNELDTELYNLSQRFIALDCQFLSLMEQMNRTLLS